MNPGLLRNLFDYRQIRLCLILAVLPTAVFYVAAISIMLWQGFEMEEILRDPAQHTKQSSFLGFVSNIGVWLWVASATLGLYASVVLGKRVD